MCFLIVDRYVLCCVVYCFFFQAEDGIRDLVRSRGLGDVYKRQDIYREAIILFEYEGYSYPQICELINVPLSTVRFRIFKAREILRGKLASLFKFPEE